MRKTSSPLRPSPPPRSLAPLVLSRSPSPGPGCEHRVLRAPKGLGVASSTAPNNDNDDNDNNDNNHNNVKGSNNKDNDNDSNNKNNTNNPSHNNNNNNNLQAYASAADIPIIL